jgi:DNA replication protein
MTDHADGGQAPFVGFPSSARATPVPNVFFSELLPQIEDDAELRVTLYLIFALGRRKGYPRFVTERELKAEAPLLAGLGEDDEALGRLEQGIKATVERGSVLQLQLEQAGRLEKLYFLNTPSDRRALEQLRDGRIPLGRVLPGTQVAPVLKRENVFQLYEENIGALTPLVAEELLEAEQLYPFEWLQDALKEAALLNKRSWRYASRILQRWATEGRAREEAGRDIGAGNSARAQILRRYRDIGSR